MSDHLLSDVHLYYNSEVYNYSDNCLCDGKGCSLSHLLYKNDLMVCHLSVNRLTRKRGTSTYDCMSPIFDDDGDQILMRKELIINIVHKNQTTLENVGLQIWNGALLLCDYLLENPELLRNHIVLDLGAGVGLTSIVASLYARHVHCTDYKEDIQYIARHNIFMNRQYVQSELPITVCKLDWYEVAEKVHGEAEDDETAEHSDDFAQLQTCDIVIAADVVYDECLTEAFFATIYKALTQRDVAVLISLERRLIFTIDDLDTVCPAYQHFQQCLADLKHLSCEDVVYEVSQINTNFPQSLDYQRTKYLSRFSNLRRVPDFRTDKLILSIFSSDTIYHTHLHQNYGK